MEAQRKKDTSKSASKRQQHSFLVTVNALKVILATSKMRAVDIFRHFKILYIRVSSFRCYIIYTTNKC